MDLTDTGKFLVTEIRWRRGGAGELRCLKFAGICQIPHLLLTTYKKHDPGNLHFFASSKPVKLHPKSLGTVT